MSGATPLHSEPGVVARVATRSRWLRWSGGVALGLCILLVLAVAFFDWNWLREPIARRVAASTGRSFAINGELTVALSWRPRVIANDIVLGNAAWSGEPEMAKIKRLDFTIDLLRLLAGHAEFPHIALSEPRVFLEVGKDGKPNWIFKAQDPQAPLVIPVVGAFTIDHGSAVYRDAGIDTVLALEITTQQKGGENPEPILEINGRGRYRGLPATLHAQGGALLSLRDAGHPYPVKATAVFGSTKAAIDGMLFDPLHLRGEQLNFSIEGSDLALLFPLIGVPFPPTPAYKLVGFLDHAGDLWTFHRFKGTVGKSDIAGDFAVDRSRQPQMITADLTSQKLLMKDLGGFIGADRGTQPARIPAAGDRVLPDGPFNLEKLQAADVDVSFRGGKIVTEQMPLEKMSAHLLVVKGVLKLAPLDFDFAGGNLVMQIEMDGRKPRIATRADITAKGLHLGLMFPASKLAAADTGTMGGRAKLEGRGNSVAQMLAAANGEAALIMDGGSVSELMLRMSNLDIANSIVVMLGGDKQVPIRCLVGNFKAIDGNFSVESLVLDTPKVNITGSGNVNFADESLHLRLVSHGKGFSLASLRGPIAIGGSFAHPLVRPELGGALARGGVAVALGVVTAGVGALLPLLDFGNSGKQDANCGALMAQAKAATGVKAGDMTPRAAKR